MLELRNIHKSFNGTEILKGVDLEVEKGDVVAILGPSGSGKTTLLRIANFLETADAGEMIFDGDAVNLPSVSRRDVAKIRLKTGFVFQNYNLFRNLTALENVTEGLRVVRGMSREEADKVGRDALAEVGMLDRADYYPSALSGGQQQRVGIARAFVAKPQVVFADEPTGNLDSKTKIDVMEMIVSFARALDQTIVLVTHDDNMAAYADRVVTLLDGRIIDDRPVAAVPASTQGASR